jgi:hypothetical protein
MTVFETLNYIKEMLTCVLKAKTHIKEFNIIFFSTLRNTTFLTLIFLDYLMQIFFNILT